MMETTAVRQQDDYRVDLTVFQGPLDLLLYLIKKEEVDIYNIPIARITRQYLEYIDLMTTLNLEVAGEFILMAATLIRIKTKMLLPRDEDNPDEPDPREELMQALIEYRKYREAGDVLKDRALTEERKYVPPNAVEKIEGRVELEPVTTFFDLLTAFRDVMKTKREAGIHEVRPQEVHIEDRIKHVLLILKNVEYATFEDLFADVPTKIVAVVTFIALLELVRSRRVTLYQSLPFAEVRVYRGEEFDAEGQDIDLIDITAIQEQVKV
ncbi:MAG: segregation/condensation protein A [Candidatus Zixiibacteriota bacterium]|nr:MAG: segregation/condensation protein A [candidate division Zixibacteria bacterium]